MTELELRAHKMESVGAIENLMSLNAYYRAANPDMDGPIQTGVRAEQPSSEYQTKTDMPVYREMRKCGVGLGKMCR